MTKRVKVTVDGQEIPFVVPEHQLERWDRWADENDMSRAAFIRGAVEAGIKQFAALDPEESNSGGRNLKEEIINTISENPGIPPEELVKETIAPIEEEVNDLIQELDEDDDRISYSPHEGGYVLK